MLEQVRSTQIIQKLSTIAIATILSFAFATAIQATTFTVTKIADTNDGTCDADCSLREAVDEASNSAGEDTIEFASPLFDTAQTITLGGNPITIDNHDVIINGTSAKLLTVDADMQSRVFQVFNGADVTFNNLTITGGNISNTGAGLQASSGVNVTINKSVIDNNHATSAGGGIFFLGQTLNINNSTISNNSGDRGGGIELSVGTAHLVNSTISGNDSDSSGGGLSDGVATYNLTNCTIVDNTSQTSGGGINVSLTPNIVNTIIANNSAPTGPDIRGTINSLDYNLIEDTTDATINGDTDNNITGLDPLLGELADNGGDTPTHRLLPGSPAIDKGSDIVFTFSSITNRKSRFKSIVSNSLGIGEIDEDQRGIARPQDIAFVPNADGGNGSDIGAYEVAPDPISIEITSFGGIVRDENGRAIPRAIVEIVDSMDNSQITRANQFGYFNYANFVGGETYIINVFSRGYSFAPQELTINEFKK